MSAPDLQPGSLRLGFGCAGAWAKPWFSERKARAVLLAALEAGVRHIDTAGFYANGEGERRLGRALQEFGEPVFVSTKTGTRLRPGKPPAKDFSDASIRADVEASLVRLGRERIDLLYLHGPGDAALGPALETLNALKKEGKIALAGVCAQGAFLERAIAAPGVDVVMGVYNVFQRAHADAFARARGRGIGVVAIAPLAQGLYRRGLFLPRSPADLWAAARAVIVKREDLRLARAGRALLEGVDGWSAAEVALAFALANPNIDVAVASTTRLAHLAGLVRASRRALPPEISKKLERGGLDASVSQS